MRDLRSRAPLWCAALVSLLLAACGGGGDGNQSPKVAYSAMVTFGDSLSDVGTYATPALKGATGGGEYTVNGAAGTNWTEFIAAQIKVTPLCAAQTGLNSSGPLVGFAAPVTEHPACTSYAQGGARVTNPVGPGNSALIAMGDNGGYLGQLTDPVVSQISRYLADHGPFKGTELVTVLAGGNDVFMNLAAIGGAQITPTQGVTAMGVAGATLANYVKSLIVGNGAKYVVVVNLPDVSQTPFALGQSTQTQGLINTMVTTFNSQLQAGLAGVPGVLQVDAYKQGQSQSASPAQYGVTNTTAPACDLVKLGATVFASSLVCTDKTLIAGDTSHYQYADTVHPTPYGYSLLAKFVTDQMALAGWL